jgi:hypothetical protein
LGVPAIGAAAYELWSARQAQAALAGESEGYAAQRDRFLALKRAAGAADQHKTTLAAALAGVRPAPLAGQRLAAGPATGSGTAVRNPKGDFQKFLATYPQAHAMLIAQQKRLAAQIYGSFFRSAALTPSQIDRFENIAAENWINLDTLSPANFALEGELVPLDAASAEEIRGLVGDPAYQQLQNYNQSAYAHFWANTVAGGLPAETSLSADQVDQLAQILASNNAAPRTDHVELWSSLASIDWDAALAQAKAALSASQWKAVGPALLQIQARGAVFSGKQSSGPAGSTSNPPQ